MSGGMFGAARPSRKLFGVMGSRSAGSVLTCVRGLVFKNASTSVSSVKSVSSVVVLSSRTAYRARFADWTGRSQTPPKWGPDCGEKRQSVPRLLDFSMTSFCFIASIANRNSFSPTVRFVPLSLYIICGLSQRAMNRRTAKNEWKSREWAISMCTARVAKQVNSPTFNGTATDYHLKWAEVIHPSSCKGGVYGTKGGLLVTGPLLDLLTTSSLISFQGIGWQVAEPVAVSLESRIGAKTRWGFALLLSAELTGARPTWGPQWFGNYLVQEDGAFQRKRGRFSVFRRPWANPVRPGTARCGEMRRRLRKRTAALTNLVVYGSADSGKDVKRMYRWIGAFEVPSQERPFHDQLWLSLR